MARWIPTKRQKYGVVLLWDLCPAQLSIALNSPDLDHGLMGLMGPSVLGLSRLPWATIWNMLSKSSTAIYNYNASQDVELSLEIGDTVHILEMYEVFSSESKFSDLDAHVKQCKPQRPYILSANSWVMAQRQHETVIPGELPLVHELTSTLREWAVIWRKLYVNNKVTLFRQLQQMTYSLIEWRSQILSGTLPKDELAELKKKVTAKIDHGNSLGEAGAMCSSHGCAALRVAAGHSRMLGLDLVVRDDNGNILDPDETSTIALFRAHEMASNRIEEKIQEEKVHFLKGVDFGH
ncbi:Dedicator of cytokinesis protein 5 [Galemys pyrenaicus]|uniref:Dedicator of cytokinesis protein 5 n=1 Tax=Galemys pyrenaicus TaxID=202257 RepID=A0A8J6ABY3_GALPY|nr:Dedicator of cytokinesis protein 5 [Galemys pyrenaicus]